ncbi:MAG: SDR family NAD(P)-dependent oxidoreductase, partial [Acidimicrobiia bacterium]|nr:SDR family NAD(P)-dependent oxidoreductase [Acidimicrobiia bacterium]
MQHKPLNGKVAIVTGAGSPIGMGRAMTFALVQAGARVAMLDINQKWLEQSAGEVRVVGGDDSVLDLVCDVSDPESVEGAVGKTIAGLGGLHVIINNAGTINLADLAGGNVPKFWDITPETWNRIIGVNSSGPFFMARAAVGHML